MRRFIPMGAIALVLAVAVALVLAPAAFAKTGRVFGDAVLANGTGAPGAITLSVVGASGTLTFTSSGVTRAYAVTSATYGTATMTGYPAASLRCVSADGAVVQFIVEDGGAPGRAHDLVRAGSGMLVTLWRVTSGNLSVRLN